MSFVDARLARLAQIPWLDGPQARAYMTALGAQYDVELGDFKFAVKQRFPTTCADDALDVVSGGFVIDRFPGESLSTFRGRLLVAWDTWRKAGTRGAIIESLNAYGVPDVEVYGNRI